jgi:hypothetical protein
VSSSQALLTTYLRNSSSLLNRKIDEATVGLAASFAKQLHSIIENSAEMRDIYYNNEPFKDLIRPTLLGFLDSFSKRNKTLWTNG